MNLSDIPDGPSYVAEVIYSAYPRHVGRRDALRAIEKSLMRLNGEEFDLIPEAFWAIGENMTTAGFLLWRVRLFASSPAGNRETYTPHPSTWFNQSRYFDDQQEWFKNAKPTTFAQLARQNSISAAQQFLAEKRNHSGVPQQDGAAYDVGERVNARRLRALGRPSGNLFNTGD